MPVSSKLYLDVLIGQEFTIQRHASGSKLFTLMPSAGVLMLKAESHIGFYAHLGVQIGG